MLEVQISWRHAIQYSNEAKDRGWKPEKLPAQQSSTCTLLPLQPSINIPDIRDWIFMAVGEDYELTAIFKVEDQQKLGILLPHLLRFKFGEMESAMLFKLAWF